MDPGVKISFRQQIELVGARGRDDELEPGRRLPIGNVAGSGRHPLDRGEVDAVIVLQHAFGPQGGAGDPGLQADALAVEVARLTNAAALVDVNIGMAKHAFDENRNGGKGEFPERQVCDIGAGEKLAYVKFAARRALLPIDMVSVHAD